MDISVIESILQNPATLEDLDKETKVAFWANRTWHPVVYMAWTALTSAEPINRQKGKMSGKRIYPDGTESFFYAGSQQRVEDDVKTLNRMLEKQKTPQTPETSD